MSMALLLFVLPTVCLIEPFEDRAPILAGTILSRHADCLRALSVPSVVASTGHESKNLDHQQHNPDSEAQRICSHVLEDVMTFFGTQLHALKVGDHVLVGNPHPAPWSHQHHRNIFVNDVTIVLDSSLQIMNRCMSLVVYQIIVVACLCLLLLLVARFVPRATLPHTMSTEMMDTGNSNSATHHSTLSGSMTGTIGAPASSELLLSRFPDPPSDRAKHAEVAGPAIQPLSRTTTTASKGICPLEQEASKTTASESTSEDKPTTASGPDQPSERAQHAEVAESALALALDPSSSFSSTTSTASNDHLERIESLVSVTKETHRKMNKHQHRFFCTLARELRTPLAIIIGSAEFLECFKTSPAQFLALQDIQESGAHALAKIEELLDFPTATEGLIAINKRANSFGSSTRATVEEYQGKYERKAMKVEAKKVTFAPIVLSA